MESEDRLRKRNLRKFLKALFRPPCFGIGEQTMTCVHKYFQHSGVYKKVLPCPHYYDCIDEALKIGSTGVE